MGVNEIELVGGPMCGEVVSVEGLPRRVSLPRMKAGFVTTDPLVKDPGVIVETYSREYSSRDIMTARYTYNHEGGESER